MQRLRQSFFASVCGYAVVIGLGCTPETGTPKADAPATQDPGTSAEVAATKPAADPLPEGADLLAEHVEASGGAAAIAKFETIHVVGTVEVKTHNLRGTMELWWRKDGNVYLEQTIEGIGKSRVGYDGETIWLEDPITGLRKLDGAEAASYKQSALLFLGHDWREHFSAANTTSKLPLGDSEVWVVDFVSKAGPNLTVGIDTKTKMITYVKSVQPSMLGDMPIEIRNDRYEPVEGYLFAMHRVNAVSKLLELDETITKFEANVPIDEAMFEFPTTREVVPADPSKQPAIGAPKPKTDE